MIIPDDVESFRFTTLGWLGSRRRHLLIRLVSCATSREAMASRLLIGCVGPAGSYLPSQPTVKNVDRFTEGRLLTPQIFPASNLHFRFPTVRSFGLSRTPFVGRYAG